MEAALELKMLDNAEYGDRAGPVRDGFDEYRAELGLLAGPAAQRSELGLVASLPVLAEAENAI